MSYIRVLDEGGLIQDHAVEMNFVGAGVAATRPSGNDRVTVTIPGAADVTGWTDDGVVVRLTAVGDRVAVGAAVSSGTEKLRVVNAAGVAVRSEGRTDLPKTGTAAAAASQAASHVVRLTASMWNAAGNAEVERDFDVYAGPSILTDDETTARARLCIDLEGFRLLNLQGLAADGTGNNVVFTNPAADSANPVFEWWAETDIGVANPVFVVSRGAARTPYLTVRGDGSTLVNNTLIVNNTPYTQAFINPSAAAVASFAILTTVATLTVADATSVSGGLSPQGTISPAALGAGATQNYAPAGFAAAFGVRITPDGGGTSALGGLAGGAQGRLVALLNIGGANLTLNHADGGSAAANQFILPGGGAHVVTPGSCALVWYDVTSTAWRLIAS